MHSPGNAGDPGGEFQGPIKAELEVEMMSDEGQSETGGCIEAGDDELGLCQGEDLSGEQGRKHQCHKCRMAFTHQNFLLQHYRSPTHRRNERQVASSYPIEKYLDPNRPFKCEICRESFTQKNILLVHYNSVSHLHKLKKHSETSTPATSPSDLERLVEDLDDHTTDPEPDDANKQGAVKRKLQPDDDYESPKKRFKCDICKVAYAQGSTLDIHMRSVLHQTRACRLQVSLISFYL